MLDLFPGEGQNGLINYYIGYVVRNAVAPFRTGNFTIFTNYLIDTMNYEVVVEVEAFPDYPFTMELSRDELLGHPRKETMSSFYNALSKHFLNRPTKTIDDHIVLGED